MGAIINLFIWKGCAMTKKVLTREQVIEILLKNYRPFYNITMCEESQKPLIAECDFFEQNESTFFPGKQIYIQQKQRNFYT